MFNTINKELKELLSNKKIWIGLLTVLIIIIIGTSYNKKNQEAVPSEVLRLGVINNDNSTYSELLLNYFNESKTFSNFVNVVTGDSETIQRAFHKGELDIYLVIPKDFARNMTQIKNSPINVTINIKDTTKAILFQNILTSYAKYITAVEANAVGLYDIMEADGMPQKLVTDTNNTISLDLIFTALGKESFFSYQPVDKFPATTVLQYYIISALFITLLYSGLYVGFSILKEAELGTAARIRTTQTSIFKLISVKMFIMCILLTALASLTFYLMFSGMITVISLLFCFAAALFCVALAAFLSSIFHTMKRFILAGNLLVFYFTVIGGGIIPIQFLPQDIIALSKATPNYYMMKGMLLIDRGQRYEAVPIITGFIILAAIMCVISVILFQKRRIAFENA